MEQEQHEQNVRSFPDRGLAMTTRVSCDGCVPVHVGKRGASWEPSGSGTGKADEGQTEQHFIRP